MIRERRVVALIVAVGTIGLLFGGAFASRALPHPQIALSSSGGFTIDGEFPSTNADAVRGPRYGSWRGSNTNTGTLISQPFVAPSALIMTIAGHPGHPDETIDLVRVDDSRQRVRLEVGADPGERWEQRLVNVPALWHGVTVRLIATDAGTGWGDWLGVADVREPYFDEAFTSDARIQTLGFGALTVTLVFPCLFIGLALCRRLGLPELFLFSAVLLILGVAAEAIFFLVMVNTTAAVTLVWAASLAGGLTTIFALRDRPFRKRLIHVDAWAPFAATALCGIAYLALFCLADSGSGSVVGFAQKWLSLPIDNILPHILAQHIWAHASPEPFIGDWLSSDRPPLQAGFDLLFGALVPFAQDGDARYQALSVMLQATVFGVLFTLCRATGCSGLRAAGILVLAWLSSFYFVNTIFVWPKLLAAAFVATSIAIFLAPGRMSPPRAATIGLGIALGLLSHGGVIFTVPALLVAWVIAKQRSAIRPILVAGALLFVVTAPWTWYQKYYDPPGDRLLKWHLAGQIPVSIEPFGAAFVKAYTTVPLATIIANKVQNFTTVLGIGAPSSESLRERQFFYVRYALSALLAPYLAALFFVRSRRPMLRIGGRFAWIALGSNVFWCAAMYIPGSAVVHQGSYLTIMLMFFAAGCVATEWLPVFVIVLGIQASLFATAWLPKFAIGNSVTAGSLTAVVVLLAAFAACIALIRKSMAAPNASPRFAFNGNEVRAYVTASGAELLTLCGIAAALWVGALVAQHAEFFMLMRIAARHRLHSGSPRCRKRLRSCRKFSREQRIADAFHDNEHGSKKRSMHCSISVPPASAIAHYKEPRNNDNSQ